MKDLTITQEYLLCAVNEKGKISSFSTEKLVCLVAAGLMELELAGCIRISDKKASVTAPLSPALSHLRPLYDFIHQPKPVKLTKILETYNYSVSDKQLNELMSAVGSSLEAEGLAQAVKTGFLGNKKGYAPSRGAVRQIVDMVRAELLEDGEITEDIACLTILLDKSGLLKTYFSSYERKEMQSRLREIIKSPRGRMVGDMVAYIENMIALMTTLTVF